MKQSQFISGILSFFKKALHFYSEQMIFCGLVDKKRLIPPKKKLTLENTDLFRTQVFFLVTNGRLLRLHLRRLVSENDQKNMMWTIIWHSQITFSVESCQSDVCEVKRDMIAIKHEIDSVQLVKDEIDEIRESLDRLEVESRRRKNKLLEQVQLLHV